ncbi:MAG: ABC transporter ATP-binding protein/permease, partial [Lachnospiraceae bacterium]|nr:ABC transporter ATP-binding protein/permease [Lachnospiraceae bacterium]
IDGIKELKMYGLYNLFEGNYRKLLDEKIISEGKLHFLPQINSALDSLLAQLCIIFAYVAGGIFILNQQMTLGSIMAFVTFSAYVIGPIAVLLNVKYKISGILPSVERVSEMQNSLKEYGGGDYAFDTGMDLSIVFREVAFSYDKSTKLITGLNIEIPGYGAYLVKGENGKGKTTLVNLLMRLLKIDGGSIEVNGRDIYEYDLEKYREQIAYIGQDPFLFKDTIYNNLTLYQKVTNKKVLDVCRTCNLETLLESKTLDYDVGSNGANLSGGQRQKVAIARALLADRRIIIFDEATSNLDQGSKMDFYRLISKIKKEKMIIMISHDEYAMGVADKVICI